MISLLGGVALFLFGMTLMGDGLKKVAGNKLEIILYKLTSTPLKGVLLGTGVTAVIQSSSATSVMVVGFVNSGMMQVRQAIGIVLGSILGTSITGWILCLSDISGSGWVSLLSTATLTGVVAVVGIVLRMFCKDLTKHHIGDILLGFAVLMYGMSSMSGAVAPLKDSAAFIQLLTRFSNPLLGVLVGTVFTCILQSASAAVGILQALAITGTITFSVAFPITLGIAIGAAVPVLLSSLGASVKGKRTAYVYLLIDVIGAVVWGVVFYAVNAAVHFPFTDTTMTTVSIALLNTIFRFATVLLLTPMIPLLEKLVSFLFPDKASTGARELKVMLAAVTRILEITINAFLDNDVAAAYRVEPLEELIDNLCDEMKLHHIDRLQTGECTLNHGFAFNDLLTNCERVSDHCSNIAVAMIELESDSFDTHEYINSVMAMHSHSFDEYYSEYSKEFQI